MIPTSSMFGELISKWTMISIQLYLATGLRDRLQNRWLTPQGAMFLSPILGQKKSTCDTTRSHV